MTGVCVPGPRRMLARSPWTHASSARTARPSTSATTSARRAAERSKTSWEYQAACQAASEGVAHASAQALRLPKPECARDAARASVEEGHLAGVERVLGPDDPHPPGADPDWVELLSGLPARHKVVFSGASTSEQRGLAARGIELAYDGMEIEL